MSVTSPFGQPTAAPPETVTEEPEATGSRTVVIAVAAGVLALGVLGGSAALLLSGGDDVAASALPPAPVGVPAEPSSTPTVSAPLPTAAVQGRNIFVPLVGDASDAEAAAGGEAAAGAPGGGEPALVPVPDAAQGSAPGAAGTSGGTGGGGAPAAPAVVASGSPASIDKRDQRVLELEKQIASVTRELEESGSDEDALRQQVAAMQAEYDLLVAQRNTLVTEKDAVQLERDAQAAQLARLRTVTFAAVPPEDPDATASALDVLVNGVPTRLDLEPREEDVPDLPDSLVLGTTAEDVEIRLTYLALDASGRAEMPPVVSLQVGSALYRVSVDGVLTFVVG